MNFLLSNVMQGNKFLKLNCKNQVHVRKSFILELGELKGKVA